MINEKNDFLTVSWLSGLLSAEIFINTGEWGVQMPPLTSENSYFLRSGPQGATLVMWLLNSTADELHAELLRCWKKINKKNITQIRLILIQDSLILCWSIVSLAAFCDTSIMTAYKLIHPVMVLGSIWRQDREARYWVLHSPSPVALVLSVGYEDTARQLEMLQGLKKREARNYTFCPILMKNRGRNTTFSSFLLKYRGQNYTNFPETRKRWSKYSLGLPQPWGIVGWRDQWELPLF